VSADPFASTAKLPIAKMGRFEAGWYVLGDGWTMTPRGNLTIGEAKAICVAAAAALRAPARQEAAE